MKKSNYFFGVMALFIAITLCVGFISCGGDGDSSSDPTPPTPSLKVSPYQLQLTSNAKSTGTFTITCNDDWNISGAPSWLTLSAISGNGNTTITVTADDENKSDEKRTAILHISAGSSSQDITVDQLPAYATGCRVSVSNELILSNGFYADLTFDKDVYGYVDGFYYAAALKTKTENEIYNELKTNSGALAKDYDYTFSSLPAASTDFIYCVIGYDKNHNYGPMTIHSFTTKPNTSTWDAALSSITYNSTQWTFTITLQSRCHHFYQMIANNSTANSLYEYADILLAYLIRDRINDPDYPNYDYSINGGTIRYERTSTDTSFLVWTWGVNDNGEFSGNIRRSYRNLSSGAVPSKMESNTMEPFHLNKSLTRDQMNELKKDIRLASVQ